MLELCRLTLHPMHLGLHQWSGRSGAPDLPILLQSHSAYRMSAVTTHDTLVLNRMRSRSGRLYASHHRVSMPFPGLSSYARGLYLQSLDRKVTQDPYHTSLTSSTSTTYLRPSQHLPRSLKPPQPCAPFMPLLPLQRTFTSWCGLPMP